MEESQHMYPFIMSRNFVASFWPSLWGGGGWEFTATGSRYVSLSKWWPERMLLSLLWTFPRCRRFGWWQQLCEEDKYLIQSWNYSWSENGLSAMLTWLFELLRQSALCLQSGSPLGSLSSEWIPTQSLWKWNTEHLVFFISPWWLGGLGWWFLFVCFLKPCY